MTTEVFADQQHWKCADLTNRVAQIAKEWKYVLETRLNRPLDMYDINGAASIVGSKLATAEVLKHFTEAVPIDELVFVTHQDVRLEPYTKALLGTERFEKTPRVFLSSKLESTGIPDVATLHQFSRKGEFALNLNTPVVTLLGGAGFDCLRMTGQGLIHEMVNIRGRKDFTLRIPVGGVWIYGGGKLDTLTDVLEGRDFRTLTQRVRHYANAFVNEGATIAGKFEVEPEVVATTPGRHGRTDYTITFIRAPERNGADPVKVKIVFEDLDQ